MGKIQLTYLRFKTNANQVQNFSKLTNLVPKPNLNPKPLSFFSAFSR